MQEDNLYVNDGTYFGGVPIEPPEQAIARKKERASTLEVLPILKAIVSQLEHDIDFYGSVDAIPSEVKLDPEKFLMVYNANELTRNVLRAKKDWIEGLIETHASNR